MMKRRIWEIYVYEISEGKQIKKVFPIRNAIIYIVYVPEGGW